MHMAILQRGSRFNDGKLIASQEYVDDHSNKKDNPHSVTKSQVGLGSVQNYGIATKAEAESGSANNKYITPLRAKEAISKLETIGVSLVLDSQVIEYDLRGSNPSPTTTQLQANVYGNSEADTDLFFQFFSRLGTATAWASMGGASASKTANVSAPSQMSQLPLRYKVEVRRGSASGAIIATDYVELVGKISQAVAGTNVTISGNTISAVNTVYSNATTSSSGLMSNTDKSKLDGVATGANNYTHPSSHPASMITESSTKRFVTDAEKSTWNSKQNALTAGSNVTITGDTISAVNTTYGVATASSNGLMASGDKSKLDGIATGANNYSHPASHPASMITESTSQRFVSDSEKSTWNAKQNALTAGTNVTISGNTISATNTTYGVATTSANGLMASADKTKLNGIATGANNYTHPSTHPYSMITGTPTSLPANGGSATSASHLLGDDTRSVNSNPSVYMSSGSRWGGRAGWQTEFKNVSTLGATSVMSGTYCYLQTHTPWSDSSGGYPIQIIYGADSPAWRVGVSNTAWSAWTKFADGGNASTVNGYTVNASVPANAKFTDTNTTYGVATTSSNGLMSSADKSKLNGVSAGATTDATANAHIAKKDNPHSVTKAQVGLGSVSNVLQASKAEFDSHVGDATHVTSTEKATWNGKQNSLTAGANITISENTISAVNTNTTYSVATTSANGLMSSTDKVKLNGIATGANNYTHPSSHPASIITQDASNRFVTDSEKATWNGKASTSTATTSDNGLMSSSDKSKLDGIAAGAQVNRTIATQAQAEAGTDNSRDMTPLRTKQAIEKLAPTPPLASTSVNGLMASTDKVKLDGIATGANNYTHPSSHPASMITESTSRRFVTDTQINNWNAKPSNLDTITNQRTGSQLKYWVGTQAQYDAIGTKDADTIYDITQ